MIERVAEAIYNTNDDPMGQAKAAIKAMRDPSEEQVAAMDDWGCAEPLSRCVYQAAIDAALEVEK